MIKSVIRINSLSGELWEIEQVEDSVICSGILNRECDVLPPGNRSAAIPDDAQHNTIFP